jgi:hypothetical protein
MRKKRNPDQLLLNLARNEGKDVVHLPYTTEFEAICQQSRRHDCGQASHLGETARAAVMNVTGFEDSKDPGTFFKYHVANT